MRLKWWTPRQRQALNAKTSAASFAHAVAQRPLADATLQHCCNDVASLFLLLDAQIDALSTGGLPHFITLSTEMCNARMHGGENPFAPQGVIPSVSEADGTSRCVTCTRHVAKWSKRASAKGRIRCGGCRAAAKWWERRPEPVYYDSDDQVSWSYSDYYDFHYKNYDYGEQFGYGSDGYGSWD
eukprot:Rhum_TRINITY_DN15250_c0_g2::Rhum_TRINITY_DN15250_c0_g2_i1::g.146036::m.146036